MSAPDRVDQPACVDAVRRWIEEVVVGLELCPFAARPLHAGRVRFAQCTAADPDAVVGALDAELTRLDADPAIDTTVLVLTEALPDFDDYNDFLDIADALLEARGLVGTIQIASFHPDYRFADVAADDASHYSNRSPLPLLHLLREDDVGRAVAAHDDPDGIPERNVARLRALGARALAERLAAVRERR